MDSNRKLIESKWIQKIDFLLDSKNKSSECNLKKFICNNCGESFSTSSNRSKHMKKACKGGITSNSYINQLQEENAEIKEQMEKAQQEIKELKEALVGQTGNITNNTTNNNTTHNTHNVNFIINNFGEENLEYITEDFLTKIIKAGPRGSIQKLLKQIYFNPNHPENQCVKISNKKLPYATVKRSNDWELQDRSQIVNSMMDKGYNIIDDHYDEIENDLESRYKGKFQEFKGDYNSQNKDLLRKIKQETELVILNGSKFKNQS